MSDAPECYTSKVRKAQKNHKCCECGTTIEKGNNYEYLSGIWDGEASSFKTCEKCASLRDYNDDYEELCFGGLEDFLVNEFGDPEDNSNDMPEDVKEFFDRLNNYRKLKQVKS